MEKYNHKNIEQKWQKYWKQHPEFYRADDKSPQEKKYILDMFPYPSGDGLHVGHVESYTATDIISRYWRLNGKNVLHPQGFDAFGLPAENYAVKTKTHPSITTDRAIKVFTRQLNLLGFSYDWSRQVKSSDPDYYKWTQWFFLLLYKNGLAYKAMAKVNWCPKCQTVLANEQAEGGVCERCETTVEQKDMVQWFFKITDFIENKNLTSHAPLLKGGERGFKFLAVTTGLLDGLDKIDWPESTKAAQKNWIGKSQGAEIEFRIKNYELGIKVFTTRLDTIFGCTYAILAPEHKLFRELKNQITNWPEVEKYIDEAKKKSELQRVVEVKEKTGVELKGVKVINPFTKKEIPLFVSDFILAHYGTGAVMAVPGHDQRDYDFAKKFSLPITEVIKSLDKNLDIKNKAYEEDGVLINSGQYNGLTSNEARIKMSEWLEQEGIGKKTINYKMRDWLISRQRYWGAPIPIIYCDNCKNKKYDYILLHGRKGNSTQLFFPWLKAELIKAGNEVYVPDLPGTDAPKVLDQVEFIMKNKKIGGNTIIISHSIGGAVAMKLLERVNKKIQRLVLVDSFLKPEFTDERRLDVEESFDWQFDFKKIKKFAREIIILADKNFSVIPKKQSYKMQKIFNAELKLVLPNGAHFDGKIEPEILKNSFISGMYPVPEKDLPVKLPTDVDFMPTGESPLTKSKNFHKVKCPVCGAKARRESDTMDTFVCSSWYYFRYADPKNKKEFAAEEKLKKWLPVDLYVGGAEHTVLHLLYSRFFTKALHNLGYIDFDEPFLKLRHQGIILAEDGKKMSKSLGNIINPDQVVKEYGADALRMFEMFMGPLEDMKPWNTKGIVGISRFLEKTWDYIFRDYIGMFISSKDRADWISGKEQVKTPDKVEILLNRTIKKVTEDIENLKFNTAISQLMILRNSFYKIEKKQPILTKSYIEPISAQRINKSDFEKFLISLSPFAPHFTEEMWKSLGHKKSIFTENWPKFDEKLIKDEMIELVIQVNSKVRARLSVAADISENDAKNLALADANIKKWLDGKEIIKVIFVKGKLINIVIK